MLTTATANIDLAALRHNLSVIRDLCPNSCVLAMIKADAYGHGLVPAATALRSADGFGVARLHEALSLRNAGFANRIVLLGTLLDTTDLLLCSEQNIDVTAHDEATLAAILWCAQRTPLRVWLKLDSGMHRIGFDDREFMRADNVLSKNRGVREVVHMTHFSCADHESMECTERQSARFWKCHESSSDAPISLANSAALIRNSATHGDWVRPGIMLYGVNPLGNRYPLPLKRVMQVSAQVIAIRDIGTREAVGYNERWVSERASRIATVGVGYADGYPRHAPNGTPVWVNGQMAGLIGQVSMDSLAIDITDIADVKVGGCVTLWGSEIPVENVARQAGTISYQLLTALNQRVAREYRGETASDVGV